MVDIHEVSFMCRQHAGREKLVKNIFVHTRKQTCQEICQGKIARLWGA